MQYEYWESIFFKNLIGAIIFFPFLDYLGYVLSDNYNLSLLLLTSVTCLFTSWLLSLKRRKFLLLIIIMAFLASILFGIAVWQTTPIITVWFISTALAIATFGFILARHLFRQTEKLFLKRWKEIIVGGILANFLRALIAMAFLFFPLPLMAVLFTASFAAVLVHHVNWS